jgi:hypothetical protein
MKEFLDTHDIKAGFVPIDMESGANTGDWVNLENWEGVAVVLFKAAGAANDDPVLTFAQATVVAGTDTKALTKVAKYMKQEGTLASITGWTKVTQTAATTITTSATAAESQGIYVIDIKAADLDVDGGFKCVQMSVADCGSAGAQIGCAFYILYGPRFANDPTDRPDPLTD